MQDWLTERARTTPTALALEFEGRQWNYGELEQWAGRMAAGLRAQGRQPGTRLALLAANRPATIALVHAAARAGLVLVPLNRRLTVAELAWQLEHVGARSLVYDESTAGTAQQLGGNRLKLLPLAALEQAGEQAGSPPPATDFLQAVQGIIFTSGTTGTPKGATLTFANHFWSATASAYRLGLNPDDRWLSTLPLYHVGGLAVVFRSCLYGTAILLQDGFDLDRFNRSLDCDRPSLTSLVPTMLYRLLQSRGSWPESLRAVLLGGAAATPELLAQAAASGLPVATTYGLTEAASQVATMRPEQVRQKPGSVGRPLMFTTVKVVDERGQEVAPGDYGELWVKGPTVMAGYDNNPEANAERLTDGWLHTGDIGYQDTDGDLWLVQRRRDVIISGGENVYPAEVEALLRRHEAVADACVVGISDPEWGQQVAAMVALVPGAAIEPEALIAFCRQHLAGYKQPRRWQLVEQLPQTASGKIARARVESAFTSDE